MPDTGNSQTQDAWVPLRQRTGDPSDDYTGPHEGVPAWMMSSLQNWIRNTLALSGGPIRQADYIEQMERRLRRWVLTTEGIHDPADGLVYMAQSNEECILDVVDYILDHPPEETGDWDAIAGPPDDVYSALSEILLDAGSVWGMLGGDGHVRLVRRVSPELELMAAPAWQHDPAGSLLTQAWRDVFGRHPDPDDGYATAIKAVESAAKPVISPKDTKATLGKMAAAMEAAPHKWVVLGDRDDPRGVLAIAGLFRLLVSRHHGRHGGNDVDTIDQKQAEAAVQLAALLVQWFRSEAIVPAT